MEKFAITINRGNGLISLFNTVLFTNRKEAEKSRQWYIAKINAERVAHAKFWGKETEYPDDISLEIAKVEVKI